MRKIQYEENKNIFFIRSLFILKASEEEVNKSGLIKLDQIRKMKNFLLKVHLLMVGELL